MNTSQSTHITIGDMPAYHAYPDSLENTTTKHPGLIIIHEIWGMNAHTRDVADRFAREGYSVIAPDLFHGQPFDGMIQPSMLTDMADPEKRDEAQKTYREITAPMQAPEFAVTMVTLLKSCVDYLLSDPHVNGRIGVVGFCFGGTYAFHLAAQDNRIKACVPLYGHPPKVEEIPDIQCPIRAFYGDQDANLMATLPQLQEDMAQAGKDFEVVVYPNAGHAFFNDTNERLYRPIAALDAWSDMLGFLSTHVQ